MVKGRNHIERPVTKEKERLLPVESFFKSSVGGDHVAHCRLVHSPPSVEQHSQALMPEFSTISKEKPGEWTRVSPLSELAGQLRGQEGRPDHSRNRGWTECLSGKLRRTRRADSITLDKIKRGGGGQFETCSFAIRQRAISGMPRSINRTAVLTFTIEGGERRGGGVKKMRKGRGWEGGRRRWRWGRR